jgi:hypothetical protein
MGVGRTLYRSANPVHGFVLNVFRARARAQCSGARNQSMGAIVATLMVNPFGEREDATGLRNVILHTNRSIASTSTVRGGGLSTSTMCSDRIPVFPHVKQAVQ